MSLNYATRHPLPLDVISIQSQVVYGTVGNNAALPTLNHFGISATAVPTVLFSNTPHYDSIHGGAIPADWFSGYLADLDQRRALDATRAVILGYLGSAEQAEILTRWLTELKERKPHVHISIDPVLGDQDCGLYVRPELAACYREHLAACADLITPNHYELGFLSESTPKSREETIAAARSLLSKRLKTVIVTSSLGADAGQIANLIVTHDSVSSSQHPRIDSDVKGTGDAFHAALTAALLNGQALPTAVETAGNWVVRALQYTAAENSGELRFPR
ncbi:MAG: pyridoxine/pyridoxal/pyridoxamine kinase [Cardiobacteriaceae bacterium]|nr:pyridoxine/pyridoxal/pyridoxamine kinase [Cardiobacteriaceae bacterium]